MSTPTFRDLIGRWPSLSEFAADLGVSLPAAKQMRARSSIAPEHWTTMVDAAKQRRIRGITTTLLAKLRLEGKLRPTPAEGGRDRRAA